MFPFPFDFNTKTFRRLLLASAVLLGGAVAAQAQVDTSTGNGGYWVGAVPKVQVAAQAGISPAVTVVAASGAAQTVAFAAYGASAYDITLSANCTFTFTAPATVTGVEQRMDLYIRNTAGTFTMTWPGTMKWTNGTAPTFVTTAGTAYHIVVYTVDGGTTYQAALS